MKPENPAVANQDDEIDLIALFLSLWQKKKLIMGVTFLFALASLAYALLAKQVWTSHAIVTLPQETDVANYLIDMDKMGVIKSQDESSLFARFKKNLVSQTKQAEFLQTTTMYEELQAKGLTKQKALQALLKDIAIEKLDNEKSAVALNGVSISFSAPTPELAQESLQAFIENMNKITKKDLLMNLQAKIDVTKVALKKELQAIEGVVNTEKQLKLQYLERALTSAQNAGIKDYMNIQYKQMNDFRNASVGIQVKSSSLYDDVFLFMLGEKYLAAQINSLKKLAVIYPTRYYDIKNQLKNLNAYLAQDQIGKTQFNVFSYQEEPSYPANRTAPKRALIVVAGTFVGLLVGTLIALFMNALASYRREKKIA